MGQVVIADAGTLLHLELFVDDAMDIEKEKCKSDNANGY